MRAFLPSRLEFLHVAFRTFAVCLPGISHYRNAVICMPASACLKNPMICSSVNLLFFMSVILHGDGLHKLYVGTAVGGQVNQT